MFDTATLEIGKDTYIFQYSLKSLSLAETLMKHPLSECFVPKKGADGSLALPDISFKDLGILFGLGLGINHPKIEEKGAEKLLEEYLSEGKNIAFQKNALQLVLGKAAGFFRTEADPQKEMKESLAELTKSKK